jgi:hypothetical protein
VNELIMGFNPEDGMAGATIRLFLVFGDPLRMRTAEISNWSGKGVAGPRDEYAHLMARSELKQPGVYVLWGVDAQTGRHTAYIGEAEVLCERMKEHKKDDWVSATFFVSKDENLTKAHIRYLEGRLIEIAKQGGRVDLTNLNRSGARLPESDQDDMEVFLSKAQQLLPVLGSDLLTPITTSQSASAGVLYNEFGGLKATGRRTPTGFVVLQGSAAVSAERPSAAPFIVNLRNDLVRRGDLTPAGSSLQFTRDVEFPSPSTAAAVIRGVNTNGLETWRDATGRTLNDIEST